MCINIVIPYRPYAVQVNFFISAQKHDQLANTTSDGTPEVCSYINKVNVFIESSFQSKER